MLSALYHISEMLINLSISESEWRSNNLIRYSNSVDHIHCMLATLIRKPVILRLHYLQLFS